MNYRIIEKESFCIVGITRRVPIQFNGVNPEIASMWKSLTSDDIDQLKKLSNVEPQGLIQASMNFSEERMEEKGELDHYVGVATTKECPENLTKLRCSCNNMGCIRSRWTISRYIAKCLGTHLF